MKHFYTILLALAAILAAHPAGAQNMMMKNASQVVTPKDGSDDVFVPISKYMAAGNVDALAAWFADNLEVSVLSRHSDASRSQARQILKNFFDTYTPRSFNITHITGKNNMKYALGTLSAGGEIFNVTIFVNCKDKSYRIQQLRIERF